MTFGGLTTLLCEGDSFSVLAGHLFATIYAFAPAAAAAVVLLLEAVHEALGRWCRRYAGAALEQRIVTCLHSLFGLVYAIQVVPYTYFVCRLMFDQDFIGSLFKFYKCAFAILNSHLVLYSIEAALRLIVRRNWLLLLHHLCFFAITAVGFFQRSFFVLKLGMIFDCFATYEVLLFVTLAVRKLGASDRAVRALLAAGLALYAATRGLQLAVLLPLFIGAYGQLAGCSSLGTWWAMAILVSILLVIQGHTFVIYAGVWRRHGSAASMAPSLASSLPSTLSLRGGNSASASSASLSSKADSDQKLVETV